MPQKPQLPLKKIAKTINAPKLTTTPAYTVRCEAFDAIGIEQQSPQRLQSQSHRFFGSVRMTYCICAFLAMTLHLCLRNTLNVVILYMVKVPMTSAVLPPAAHINANVTHDECGAMDVQNDAESQERNGELLWSRNQQFHLQSAFYYGYIVTLPIGGRLTDAYGGKRFFVHSIAVQALSFALMPYCARFSYVTAICNQVGQGLIAGMGNPSIYQLFTTWAHPTERTALLSFAYSGYSVGSLLAFPISSYLCQFGWDMAFYVIGGVALVIGASFQWLVYSSLDEHPRLTRAEHDYLKVANVPKSTATAKVTATATALPWKAILTSVPVYAFTLTHIFHSYGIIVFSIMMPRYLKEAMRFPFADIGICAAAPFLGAFISKALTITSCNMIEKRPNLNLTVFRRIVYVTCNCITILLLVLIIRADCTQRMFVVLCITLIGITTDLSFTGAYWPSLLFVAPSFAGLLSGFANCLATVSGVLAPIGISTIVVNGLIAEWNYVLLSVLFSYALGALVYGCFGSSKLQSWDLKFKPDNR